MRILVLGGTAWLGGEIARRALERGHQVTCLARGRAGSAPVGATFVALGPGAADGIRAGQRAGLGPGARRLLAARTRAGRARGARRPGPALGLRVLGLGLRRALACSTRTRAAPLLPPFEGEEATGEDYGSAKVACERLVRRCGRRPAAGRARRPHRRVRRRQRPVRLLARPDGAGRRARRPGAGPRRAGRARAGGRRGGPRPVARGCRVGGRRRDHERRGSAAHPGGGPGDRAVRLRLHRRPGRGVLDLAAGAGRRGVHGAEVPAALDRRSRTGPASRPARALRPRPQASPPGRWRT